MWAQQLSHFSVHLTVHLPSLNGNRTVKAPDELHGWQTRAFLMLVPIRLPVADTHNNIAHVGLSSNPDPEVLNCFIIHSETERRLAPLIAICNPKYHKNFSHFYLQQFWFHYSDENNKSKISCSWTKIQQKWIYKPEASRNFGTFHQCLQKNHQMKFHVGIFSNTAVPWTPPTGQVYSLKTNGLSEEICAKEKYQNRWSISPAIDMLLP